MKNHFKRFALVFLIFEIFQAAILVKEAPLASRNAPKDRKLLFTWDRDQEFYRHEDRERC